MPKPPNQEEPPPRSRIDLEDIRLFAVVARHRSINAATKELRLGNSAISRRLDELEARLNAKLLHRGSNGVTLTEAGERALDRAITIHRLAEEFERSLLAADARPEGRVTVASPDLFATYCLAPFIGTFLVENPRIEVILDVGFWQKFPPRDPHDIVLTFDSTDAKLDEVWTPVATQHFCCFASREYLATFGRPKTLAAMADHRFSANLAHGFQPESWGAREAAVRALGVAPLITNCGAVTVQSVISGAGIAVLPTYMARHLPPEVEMLLDGPVASLKLWLAYHRESAQTTRIRTVLNWLRSMLDSRTNPWFREEFIHPRDFQRALTEFDDAARSATRRSEL